jgi:alpha-1,6-mannosyltransferase
MTQEPSPTPPPVALAGPVAGAPLAGAAAASGPAAPAGRVSAPALAPALRARLRLPARARALSVHPRAGRYALATIIAGVFLVVAYATAGENVLVPRAYLGFPPWDSGPLHLIFRWLPVGELAINIGFSTIVVVLFGAWLVAVASVRTLPLRTIALSILAVHAIVLLAPPIQLNDVWNYLGYARLGGLHHLSPYTHTMADEVHDPIYRFSSWHNLSSPYGPLFSALSYPLAFLPIPLAYWLVKLSAMLTSLALIAVVHRCARQLGRDPRFAVLFLAANPIYVIYAMGGFHNDFLMLLASLGAVSLLLDGRDRTAGAVLMLAVAVKFTAVLLLPFLILAAGQSRRRREVIVGSALGALPLLALSLALFGPHLPNLSDQSTLLTPFSIPNVVGLIIGADGGAPWLLRVANVAVVLLVAWLLRRRGDWLSSAGWATVGLIASLAWLMPWYVIWVLPLAGLGTSVRLRRVAVVLSAYLILTFVPITGLLIYKHGLNPLNTRVGHASSKLQKTLEQYPNQ